MSDDKRRRLAPKAEMTSLDVRAAVRELRELKGARIDKFYEIDKEELLLRVRGGQPLGRRDLAILVGKALHVTELPRETPDKPTSFAMQIRKHLTNGFVDEVRQHHFDRVIEFVSHRKDGTYLVVVELFADGNVVLVKDDKILMPLFHQSWAHREVRPGAEWVPPPPRIDPGTLSEDAFRERVMASNADAVRTLATEVNLGGPLAEEVCVQAGVPKNKQVTELSQEEVGALLGSLRAIMERVESGELEPVVVRRGEEKVDVAPFPMAIHEGLDLERFPTFQAALDAYFGRAATVEKIDPRLKKVEEEKKKVDRMLQAQRAAVTKFERQDEEARLKGDLIYGHFDTAQRVTKTLWEASKSVGWATVQEKLKEGKAQGNPEAQLVDSVNPHEGTATLVLEDADGKATKVRVDLRKSVQENADDYYETSKKMREKREGALEALERTEKRMKELDERGVEIVQKLEEQEQRKPQTKRFWFDNYRWFRTSDGHIVVAGRDVRSNERVVSKNLESSDRYLHADVSGASSVVVKAKDGEVSETALEEAASFAASMSRAWNAGHAEAQAYWVTPEQVSKTPNPGEYVPKGSFIVRGKRTFLRAPVRLAIGEVEIDGARKIMSGPVSAVEAQSDRYVIIEPGQTPTNQLANRLADVFDVNVEEVQAVMPPASVRVVEEHGLELQPKKEKKE